MLTSRIGTLSLKHPLQHYACPNRDAAYTSLLTSIRAQSSNHIVLTGDSGVGKTYLLHRLVQETKSSTLKAIYCTAGTIDVSQLYELQVSLAGSKRHHQLTAIRHYIQECSVNNIALVVIIDDAHQLDEAVVQQLLGLLQSQTAVFRLVLCGQTTLLDRINSWRSQYSLLANMFLVHLSCLTPAGTQKAINYWASVTDELEFTADAIERIELYSKGRPALINMICRQAMKLALAKGAATVCTTTVDFALAELESENKIASAVLNRLHTMEFNTAQMLAEKAPSAKTQIPAKYPGFFKPRQTATVAMLVLALSVPVALVIEQNNSQNLAVDMAIPHKAVSALADDNIAQAKPDPGHAVNQLLLQQTIDTYIDWSIRQLIQRANSVATYVIKARSMYQHALTEQASALSKRSASQQYELAQYSPRTDDTFIDWLDKLDRRLQVLDQQIDQKLATHTVNTL